MGTSPKLIHQQGLSLIEVLVALIIFAFGMLGVAGLQVATLKSNKYAASSAIAISLAREYGELMQSFPSVNISTSTGASPFFIDTSTFLTPNPSLCTGNSAACTSVQLAQAAMQDWSRRVKEALPGGGRAEICRTSEPRNADGDLQWAHCDGIGDLVVVKIGWAARSDKGETLFDSDRPKILLPLLGNLRDFAAP